MASISKIKLPNGVTYTIQDKTSGFITPDALSDYATQTYAREAAANAVAEAVDSAPETLNTLNELAAALGDDPNFATTVSNEIGKKSSTVLKTWTSADV